jgi:hypothetical protein
MLLSSPFMIAAKIPKFLRNEGGDREGEGGKGSNLLLKWHSNYTQELWQNPNKD